MKELQFSEFLPLFGLALYFLFGRLDMIYCSSEWIYIGRSKQSLFESCVLKC